MFFSQSTAVTKSFDSTLMPDCLSTFITWRLFWWPKRWFHTCNISACVARWTSATCCGIHTRIANT
jgi:hypothetical protein